MFGLAAILFLPSASAHFHEHLRVANHELDVVQTSADSMNVSEFITFKADNATVAGRTLYVELPTGADNARWGMLGAETINATRPLIGWRMPAGTKLSPASPVPITLHAAYTVRRSPGSELTMTKPLVYPTDAFGLAGESIAGFHAQKTGVASAYPDAGPLTPAMITVTFPAAQATPALLLLPVLAALIVAALGFESRRRS